MHLPGLPKPSPLRSMKYIPFVSSPISSASDESASSGESLPLQPHYSPGTPNLIQSQLVLPAWVTAVRALLRDRSTPANRLKEQHSTAAPITSEKMHRDLVVWSARVASTERELRFILQELKAEGLGIEDVLLAIQEDQDYQVVERLWMK
jgi:hypothetical protein